MTQKRSQSRSKLEENQCKNIANQLYGKSIESTKVVINGFYIHLQVTTNLCVCMSPQLPTMHSVLEVKKIDRKLKDRLV